MDKIDITKRVFDKRQYEKVIPTQFTQLTPTIVSNVVNTPSITVNQLFDYYNQLFYNIPATGDTNSHEYLIKQSSLYVGANANNEEVEALLSEIESLRATNLDLNNQILNLNTTGSNATVV